jgi:hypothetical protein
MEFPEEVLRLISEYSRPWFKYFREYKRMLQLCGFQDWNALHYALQTKPAIVLPCLYAHEKAQTAWLNAYHEVLDREEKIRRGYYRKQDARARTFRELVKSLEN